MALDLLPSPFFDKAPSFHRIVPKAPSEADIAFWSARLADWESGGGGPVRSSAVATDTRPRTTASLSARPCFNYRAESETERSPRYKWRTFPTRNGGEWDLTKDTIGTSRAAPVAKVQNRIRVYPSGELEMRTVMRKSDSKPPPPAYGARFASEVSGNGRRVIRRSVNALVERETCQVAMYTLTSQALMPDRDFNKALHAFLAWGRKYVPHVFKHYIIACELQQRGTLHAHLLLFKRVPKGLWRRMRDLWAVRYGMGSGSFDVKKIRSPKRAAAYLTKYLTNKKPHYKLGLDAEGMLHYERWRIGRNGEPYLRVKFRGNAYRVSDAMRLLALPVGTYFIPWGCPQALTIARGLKGGVQFWPSQAAALWRVFSTFPSGP